MKNTVWVKRVVMANGEPVTKGRPTKETNKARTCLYIQAPKGMGVGKVTYGAHIAQSTERPYNPKKNADQRRQFKRTLVRTLTPYHPPVAVNAEPVTVEAVAVEPVSTPEVVEAPAELVTA
jgi:hypothetical protein